MLKRPCMVFLREVQCQCGQCLMRCVVHEYLCPAPCIADHSFITTSAREYCKKSIKLYFQQDSSYTKSCLLTLSNFKWKYKFTKCFTSLIFIARIYCSKAGQTFCVMKGQSIKAFTLLVGKRMFIFKPCHFYMWDQCFWRTIGSVLTSNRLFMW